MADDFDLEGLVHLEQTFFDSGYKDGFEHGRIHGLIEGRALGREKGFEMWEELGFYEGFAHTWLKLLEKQGKAEDRAANHARHLVDLIAHFPHVNPSSSDNSDLDIPKLFRQIRSRYKVLCSSLGIRPTLRANLDSTTEKSNEEESIEGQNATTKSSVWRLDNATAPSNRREEMSY